MITHLVHRRTGERLAVELEIGQTWWLKDRSGHVSQAQRSDYSPATWELLGKDVPVEAQGFTIA